MAPWHAAVSADLTAGPVPSGACATNMQSTQHSESTWYKETETFRDEDDISIGTWSDGLRAIEEFDWGPQFGDEEVDNVTELHGDEMEDVVAGAAIGDEAFEEVGIPSSAAQHLVHEEEGDVVETNGHDEMEGVIIDAAAGNDASEAANGAPFTELHHGETETGAASEDQDLDAMEDVLMETTALKKPTESFAEQSSTALHPAISPIGPNFNDEHCAAQSNIETSSHPATIYAVEPAYKAVENAVIHSGASNGNAAEHPSELLESPSIDSDVPNGNKNDAVTGPTSPQLVCGIVTDENGIDETAGMNVEYLPEKPNAEQTFLSGLEEAAAAVPHEDISEVHDNSTEDNIDISSAGNALQAPMEDAADDATPEVVPTNDDPNTPKSQDPADESTEDEEDNAPPLPDIHDILSASPQPDEIDGAHRHPDTEAVQENNTPEVTDDEVESVKAPDKPDVPVQEATFPPTTTNEAPLEPKNPSEGNATPERELNDARDTIETSSHQGADLIDSVKHRISNIHSAIIEALRIPKSVPQSIQTVNATKTGSSAHHATLQKTPDDAAEQTEEPGIEGSGAEAPQAEEPQNSDTDFEGILSSPSLSLSPAPSDLPSPLKQNARTQPDKDVQNASLSPAPSHLSSPPKPNPLQPTLPTKTKTKPPSPTQQPPPAPPPTPSPPTPKTATLAPKPRSKLPTTKRKRAGKPKNASSNRRNDKDFRPESSDDEEDVKPVRKKVKTRAPAGKKNTGKVVKGKRSVKAAPKSKTKAKVDVDVEGESNNGVGDVRVEDDDTEEKFIPLSSLSLNPQTLSTPQSHSQSLASMPPTSSNPLAGILTTADFPKYGKRTTRSETRNTSLPPTLPPTLPAKPASKTQGKQAAPGGAGKKDAAGKANVVPKKRKIGDRMGDRMEARMEGEEGSLGRTTRGMSKAREVELCIGKRLRSGGK